jgi:hypothetical protein
MSSLRSLYRFYGCDSNQIMFPDPLPSKQMREKNPGMRANRNVRILSFGAILRRVPPGRRAGCHFLSDANPAKPDRATGSGGGDGRGAFVRLERLLPVRPVAERARPRVAAATQRDLGFSRGNHERVPKVIHDLHGTLDHIGTIFATTNDERLGHGVLLFGEPSVGSSCLLNEYSGRLSIPTRDEFRHGGCDNQLQAQ